MSTRDEMRDAHPHAALLDVSGLTMRFGGLLAVDQVSLAVGHHEIFAIIGPNGAGKTTVFNCISGFYKPSSGRIRLDGQDMAAGPVTSWPVTAWCAPSRTCGCSNSLPCWKTCWWPSTRR